MRIINLPLPASHTLSGPSLSLSGGRLVVRYDAVLGDQAEWGELWFHDVIRVGYRDMSICTEDDIMGHDYFTEEAGTPELHELQARRSTFFGQNRFENERDANEPFKLYRLYFDDAAAVDIVARSCETRLAPPEDLLGTG